MSYFREVPEVDVVGMVLPSLEGARQERVTRPRRTVHDEIGPDLGLAPVPEQARSRLGLEPGASGLLVQQVETGSPAAETGPRPGDVILSVNDRPVCQPADVANAWSEAQRQGRPGGFISSTSRTAAPWP